jgi:hypothetical protein
LLGGDWALTASAIAAGAVSLGYTGICFVWRIRTALRR